MTWKTHDSQYVNQPLKTIENARPLLRMRVEHMVLLPILCPVSQNPAKGSTLNIAYQAGERLLELFALEAYIASYYGHIVVRDMEFFVQVVGEECAQALGHEVHMSAEITYAGLAQRQRVDVIVP